MKPILGIMVTYFSSLEGVFSARGLTRWHFCGKFAPEKGCDEDTRGRSEPQREAGW